MMLKNIRLTNEQYDKLKDFITIWLPAIGTLYTALAVIWGLPYSEAVVGTIAAVVTFFGSIMKVSTNNYRAEKIQDNFNTESIEEMMGEDYEDQDNTAEE